MRASRLLSVLASFNYYTSFVVGANKSNSIWEQLIFCVNIMLAPNGDPRNILMRRVQTLCLLGYFMLILISLRASYIYMKRVYKEKLRKIFLKEYLEMQLWISEKSMFTFWAQIGPATAKVPESDIWLSRQMKKFK